MKSKRLHSYKRILAESKAPYLLTKELFYALSTGIVFFVFLEIVWPGVVIAYLNLSLILLIWFINAILMLILDNNQRD